MLFFWDMLLKYEKEKCMNDYILLLSGSFKYFFLRLYKVIKVSGYQSWGTRREGLRLDDSVGTMLYILKVMT